MGLKTNNFFLDKKGANMPTAYAKLRTLHLHSDDSVEASFGIYPSREIAKKYEPMEIVHVVLNNKWDRKTSLQKVVYDAIKSETYSTHDSKGVPTNVTVKNALFGWTDDILQ